MSPFPNFESDTSQMEYLDLGMSSSLNGENFKYEVSEAASDNGLSYQYIQNKITPLADTRPSAFFSYTKKIAVKTRYPRIKLKSFNEPATTAQSVEKLFNDFDSLLVSLVNDYSAGKKDIYDLVRELGDKWTPSSVIVLLERFGAYRDILSNALSTEDKTNVLRKLAGIRASNQSSAFNDKKWLQREVIASQRIEFVDVVIEDFDE